MLPLRLRLVAAGWCGIGRTASRRSPRGRPQRAIALPLGAAQGAPEVGALALDGHHVDLVLGVDPPNPAGRPERADYSELATVR